MRWLVIIFLVSMRVCAQNSSINLQIPNGPTSYQSDSFRAGNLDCSNAIGGGTNLEFGVIGVIAEDATRSIDENKDIGVYARITIPLDKPAERINCNELFELELQQRRLEILKLEQELAELRALAEEAEAEVEFEN